MIAASCSTGSSNQADSVTVFAAASLTDVFTALAHDMRAAGGPEITLSFAGSSTLATQLIEGAPADVFASANNEQMDRVIDVVATADAPTVFARNELVIVVEEGNPLGITDVAELARADVVLALADPAVPAGAYAAAMFAAAGITVEPATLESDVRSVLTKVELGEVDAGIVYATDAASSDRVDAIEVPDEIDQVAEYPVVALAAGDPDAISFIEYLMSEAGRERLIEFGFAVP